MKLVERRKVGSGQRSVGVGEGKRGERGRVGGGGFSEEDKMMALM